MFVVSFIFTQMLWKNEKMSYLQIYGEKEMFIFSSVK